MNNKLLPKAILSVSLILGTLVGAKAVFANSQMDDLNLTEAQVEQLKEYRQSKKESNAQKNEAQKEADRAALSEFLSDEQVAAVLDRKNKGEKGEKGKKHNKGNKGANILEHAQALDLTENQIAQINTIIENNQMVREEGAEKPSREEMKAKRDSVKAQIQAVLTDAQIEILKSLRKK